MKIVDYVGNNASRFKDLVDVFVEGPYRVTQRAGWPLGCCVEHNPALIGPHLKRLLAHLNKPGIHDSVKRNTIRLLQFIEIPKSLHGRVADVCFSYLGNKKEPVAVRVFSMTVLEHISKRNPDLKSELRLLIEDSLPYGTPAFTSRARKVLKNLRAGVTESQI